MIPTAGEDLFVRSLPVSTSSAALAGMSMAAWIGIDPL